MTAERRDALIRAVLDVAWPDGSRDGLPNRPAAERIADSLLASGVLVDTATVSQVVQRVVWALESTRQEALR
jgi:hypothetical protein